MSDEDAALVAPQVTSLAKPKPVILLAARRALEVDVNLKTAFQDAYKARETVLDIAEQLTEVAVDLLFNSVKGEEEELREVARYLVDEYLQLGPQLMLVSTTTGRPIMTISEKDLWQPPPVERDVYDMDGRPTGEKRLVPQQPRLRPDLEGMLIRTFHDKHRERALKSELAIRVFTPEGLAAKGDPRLATVTKEGRAAFLEALKGDLDGLLPGAVSGLPGQFLRFVGFGEPVDASQCTVYREQTVFAKATTISLVDHKARNFKFDQGAAVRRSIAAGWVTQIAEKIGVIAKDERQPDPIDFAEYRPSGEMYVAADDVLYALRSTWAGAVLPVRNGDLSCPYAILRPFAYIVIRETDARHRVVHDRWQMVGSLDFDLWVDWSAVIPLHFKNVPAVRTSYAEVV